MNIYSNIATGIFDYEFGGDTGIATVSQISGWLSANVGGLNVLLHTNFSGENPAGFNDAAANVFSDMYMKNYYDRASRNALRGVIQSSINGDNILSVSDGDNKISFVNKNEVAKTYRGFSASLDASIKEKAYKYSFYEAVPRQLCGIEASISGNGYPYHG